MEQRDYIARTSGLRGKDYVGYALVDTAGCLIFSLVTTDDGERNKLSVFRSIGAALGSIPVLLIASFAYAKRLDADGQVVMGENGKAITDMQYAPVLRGVILMAVASLALLLVAFALNKERVQAKPQPREKGGAKKAVGMLFRNRAFVAVSLASMLLLSGQMFTQSFYTYCCSSSGAWRRKSSCGCSSPSASSRAAASPRW